tara:strand:- start:446 stop:1099 length:654 start_codon:yes stop_codon:yes gene_type:complete
MTNSNDTYGTYNKTTTILSQPDKAIQEGTGSTISQNLVSITLNNPVRVVVVPAHAITDSLEVTFASVSGTTELNGNTYYAKKINDTTIDLYSNQALSTAVDGTSFTSYVDDDGGTITYDSAKTVFANTDSAISHFFTSDAQAVFNECCTDLQWALVADDNGDNTKVKYTMSFGTKGPGTSKENDWAGQFNSRKKTLIDNSGWSVISFGTANSTDHLF